LAHQPKYGPPYQPPKGDGPPDPDKGKDLSSEVPQLAVPAPWNSSPPSFNDDPPKVPAGAGELPKNIPLTWEFKINMASVRAAMGGMLSDTQIMVGLYQELRNTVFAAKDDVFGQNALVRYNTPSGASVMSGSPQVRDDIVPSKIQQPARAFADSINPAQEKALEQIANSIELVGRFIAGVDRAGQSYGAADRKAEWPAPPANPVEGSRGAR
jgi:hypothetical protein